MTTILHLGLGSFHRAHQAVYLQQLHDLGERSWSIVGGNIRPDMTDVQSALIAQHGSYTVETIDPGGIHAYQRIDCLARVIAYAPDHRELVEIGAREDTPIISFTVTEAGYYLDDHHRLDLTQRDLALDLETGAASTIYGCIARILGERLRRGGAPVTLLNCDNLRSNGERFRGGLVEYLERRQESHLREWVLTHTKSPNAMVDRITPRPTEEVGERVRRATGIDDRAAVMGEAFIQWVIEDDFAGPRPPWERVGVELVDSVLPYEEAKIRILNASHSCIAWAGTLIGLQYIHEGAQDARIRRMAYDYVSEDVIACLNPPAAPSPIDLARYRDTVLDRFSNPFLRDTNQRVAMDGFSKIPGFIVPTLREQLAARRPIAATALLPALFFVFLREWHEGRLSYAYQDQVMDPDVAHALFAKEDALAAFARLPVLWGPLAGSEVLESAMRARLPEIAAFRLGGGHE